jgi:putative hydrolase of the HAD superfamily
MQVPQHIKNVIFDFGAVILDIDGTRTSSAFRDLGVHQFESFQQFLVSHDQQELFHQIETGDLTPAEFRNGIRKWSDSHLSDSQIDAAWNAMLVGYRVERLDLLIRLKKRYRTFLLSNTNSIHWDCFSRMLHPLGYEGLHVFFEKDYYSHLLHMRKPDAAIYHHVLSDAGLDPRETLFLDDNLMNLEGARAVGITSIQVTEANDIIAIFQNL